MRKEPEIDTVIGDICAIIEPHIFDGSFPSDQIFGAEMSMEVTGNATDPEFRPSLSNYAMEIMQNVRERNLVNSVSLKSWAGELVLRVTVVYREDTEFEFSFSRNDCSLDIHYDDDLSLLVFGPEEKHLPLLREFKEWLSQQISN